MCQARLLCEIDYVCQARLLYEVSENPVSPVFRCSFVPTSLRGLEVLSNSLGFLGLLSFLFQWIKPQSH